MANAVKDFQPQVTWDAEVAAYLRDALGPDRFARTAEALSRPPVTTCLRVNTLQTTPEEVVAKVRQQLGPEWPADVVQIHPKVPCAVLLRGSGPHKASYEAAGGREVVVSRKAGEAVLRGAPVYAPGVLAVSSGVSRGDLVALAVARERPGSDVPEITRGTTLYTAGTSAASTTPAAHSLEPESAGGPDMGAVASMVAEAAGVDGPGHGSHQADGSDGAALAAREEPCGVNACCEGGGAAGSNAPDSSPAAAGTAAELPGGCSVATGTPAAAAAAAGVAGVRQRRRQRRAAGQGPQKRPAGTQLIAGIGTVDGGGREGDGGSEGCGPEANEATAMPSGDAVMETVSGGVATDSALLLPGWTDSSQGPIPPRMGMYVGLARAAMSRQEMFRAREGLALELVEPVFRVPPAAALLPPGHAMLQNLPSIVAALALAPAPGCRLLDMCAAPGGKTTLLAQIMRDKGEVVAFDRTHSKAGEVVSLAKELGVTCIRAQKMDAGKALQRAAPQGPPFPEGAHAGTAAVEGTPAGVAAPGAGFGTTEAAAATAAAVSGAAAATKGLSDKARQREERRRAAMLRRGITPPAPPDASLSSGPAAYPPESFDHVLLDAPCSALGLRPRLQQQATCLYLRQCAAAQRRLIDTAVRLLRVGGNMVYSTCTINPGENEACVRYLLDKYGSSFRLVPAGPPFLGGPGLVGRHPTMAEAGRPLGAAAAAGEAACDQAAAAAGGQEGGKGGGEEGGEQWLTEEEARLVQRFDPADLQLDSIGFFVAKFVKVASVAED